MIKPEDDLARFRRLAEERLARGKSLYGDRGEEPADARRLLHELRVHQVELELQNEELRETRAKAEESLTQYLDLYEFAPVPYLTIDLKGTIVQANLAAATEFGTARSRLVGRSLRDRLVAEDQPSMSSFIERTITSRKAEALEIAINVEGGPPKFFRIAGSCRDEPDGKCLLALINISEREQARIELDRSSQENAMLMRELQHRVKNSLSVVYSLLGLGGAQVEDKKARDILEKARAKVLAMTKIYEELYLAGKVLSVDLWSYLEKLIAALLETYAVDRSRVRLVTHFGKVRLDAQRAALTGLMLSELVSNATKYAYPEGSRGELRVSLLEREGAIELVVSDDGPGLPGGIDPATTESMGFNLLRMLADQMRADLVFVSAPGQGVTITLRFRP